MASTTLTPFHYGDELVRTYEENGEIWFIATDVARILGYRSAPDMTRNLEEDEVGAHIVRMRAGSRSVSVISLAGLFHVLNTARVEAVRPFKRWVNHEILPSIYRTGSYSLSEAGVAPDAEDRALTRAQRLVEIHMLARGVVSPDHLEAKIRIILAQARGEHPEIEAKARPLYIQDYMRGKGVSGKKLRSYAPTFGEYVKEAYRDEHDGKDPGVYLQDTPSGQVREVCAYTEADRPPLDRIWNERYAEKLGGDKE